MSVVIQGMKMPKSCDECPCYYETEGAWRNECEVFGKEYIASENRPEWCPLVELPPHGRLIDADALMQIIREHDYPLKAHFNSTDNGMFTIGIQQAVDEALTIIPAEEGE